MPHVERTQNYFGISLGRLKLSIHTRNRSGYFGAEHHTHAGTGTRYVNAWIGHPRYHARWATSVFLYY
jgi:hypothetical protein